MSFTVTDYAKGLLDEGGHLKSNATIDAATFLGARSTVAHGILKGQAFLNDHPNGIDSAHPEITFSDRMKTYYREAAGEIKDLKAAGTVELVAAYYDNKLDMQSKKLGPAAADKKLLDTVSNLKVDVSLLDKLENAKFNELQFTDFGKIAAFGKTFETAKKSFGVDKTFAEDFLETIASKEFVTANGKKSIVPQAFEPGQADILAKKEMAFRGADAQNKPNVSHFMAPANPQREAAIEQLIAQAQQMDEPKRNKMLGGIADIRAGRKNDEIEEDLKKQSQKTPAKPSPDKKTSGAALNDDSGIIGAIIAAIGNAFSPTGPIATYVADKLDGLDRAKEYANKLGKSANTEATAKVDQKTQGQVTQTAAPVKEEQTAAFPEALEAYSAPISPKDYDKGLRDFHKGARSEQEHEAHVNAARDRGDVEVAIGSGKGKIFIPKEDAIAMAQAGGVLLKNTEGNVVFSFHGIDGAPSATPADVAALGSKNRGGNTPS